MALATEDAGVLVYHPATNRIEPLVNNWSLGSISDFTVKENQVWIAVPRKGISIVDRQSGTEKLFRDYQGISLLSVNSVLKDREGNIWLGSKSGLTRTHGDAVEHLDDFASLRDVNVLALAIDGKDRIWFSTSEGLFVRSRNPDGSSTITKKLLSTGFQNTPVISLYADEEGFIWAGLYGSGLLRINPENDRIKHFQQELRNGNVLGITGKGTTLWIATLGGSTFIDFTNGKYDIRNYSSQDGLSSDFIYQVFIDSKNRKWFATDGKGVSMLDDKGFHHFEEGLPSKVIYGFAEDVNHDLWVTSQDNGLLKFDGQKFVQIPQLRLRDNFILSMFADLTGIGKVLTIGCFDFESILSWRKPRIRHLLVTRADPFQIVVLKLVQIVKVLCIMVPEPEELDGYIVFVIAQLWRPGEINRFIINKHLIDRRLRCCCYLVISQREFDDAFSRTNIKLTELVASDTVEVGVFIPYPRFFTPITHHASLHVKNINAKVVQGYQVALSISKHG